MFEVGWAWKGREAKGRGIGGENRERQEGDYLDVYKAVGTGRSGLACIIYDSGTQRQLFYLVFAHPELRQQKQSGGETRILTTQAWVC